MAYPFKAVDLVADRLRHTLEFDVPRYRTWIGTTIHVDGRTVAVRREWVDDLESTALHCQEYLAAFPEEVAAVYKTLNDATDGYFRRIASA